MILKKTAAAVMAAAMIMTNAVCIDSSTLAASAAQNRSGICAVDYVDIREDADPYAWRTGWLDGGDHVEILDEKYDSYGKLWYYMVYSGIYGYVPADSISENGTGNVKADDNVSYDMSNYESYLNGQGFPESYKVYLRELHKQHPSWIFTAQHLGIDWNRAVDEECVIGRNLVHDYAPDSWKSMERGAYDFGSGTWYQLDTGWVAASEEIIQYYMDPRNFLSEEYVFMFENLSYDPDVHTLDGVEAILRGSFMDGWYTCPDTGDVLSYAQTFMEAAAVSGVSPYHLASRCRNEQGAYGAPQSLGTAAGYEGYYNFFDIQAFATANLTAGQMAALYASNYDPDYLMPWTNQYKSIIGGSMFLGNGYINREQDTLYLQKFDMTDGGNGYFAHQYMTCVFGQANEATSMLYAYSDEVLASAMEFKIPVYDNMPEYVCLEPGSSRDNNDYLDSLSISGVKLSPSFNRYTQNYTASVSSDTDGVNISASSNSSNATVYGTGYTALSGGSNTVNITCISAGGTQRVYTINIEKAAESYSEPVEFDYSTTDVNGDGDTNITDAMILFGYVANKRPLSSSEYSRADIDRSGEVNITDAMAIIRIICGR
ncbi:dockerin type I domain-containing protein [Ruminococcus sp.]|uniref:dockerin type I domain-containing protein n=1 Tax=Ruminococcus sp. TaxID=41978 RepID=UPI0025F5373E|nr:dockerin type I domain-containing protein [Ruminococcus sp.]MBQ8967910.1 cadherin-like beta sandwich domain-containing protein [Ruminococcus sp.]